MIDKTNFKKVFFVDDAAHASRAVELAREFRPDVVLAANTPLRINKALQEVCEESGAAFVFWVQDLFGEAAKRLLADRWAGAGKLVGAYMSSFERSLLKNSHAVVLIAEAFRDHVPAGCRNVSVIENWAPLDEMPVGEKANAWSVAQGLDKTTNFVYSGTLGLKHNPDLLVRLAERTRDKADHRVVVVSQGKGIEHIRAKGEELGLKNLVLLPFQPFEDLPDVLASADVLLAILEPDAGVFSVPSKVLSYLCAGRAMLLAVPPENLASQIVSSAGAGLVVPPTDEDGFAEKALELSTDQGRREQMGSQARAYAEKTFDIGLIAERFLRVFESARRAV